MRPLNQDLGNLRGNRILASHRQAPTRTTYWPDKFHLQVQPILNSGDRRGEPRLLNKRSRFVKDIQFYGGTPPNRLLLHLATLLSETRILKQQESTDFFQVSRDVPEDADQRASRPSSASTSSPKRKPNDFKNRIKNNGVADGVLIATWRPHRSQHGAKHLWKSLCNIRNAFDLFSATIPAALRPPLGRSSLHRFSRPDVNAKNRTECKREQQDQGCEWSV